MNDKYEPRIIVDMSQAQANYLLTILGAKMKDGTARELYNLVEYELDLIKSLEDDEV